MNFGGTYLTASLLPLSYANICCLLYNFAFEFLVCVIFLVITVLVSANKFDLI